MPSPVLPSGAKRTGSTKRSAERRSWEEAALDRKFMVLKTILVVFGAFTIVAVGFMIHRAASNRSAEDSMPRVAMARAPELVKPFICDLETGFHTGGIQTFLRNVGNGSASNVVETFALHVVPERKVGIADFDEIPRGNCSVKPSGSPLANRIGAGQETRLRLPEPVVALPPLLNGETAQLYGLNCIYYSDASGSEHSICETRRFRLTGGTPVFACDNTVKTGEFDATPVATCGN